MKLDMRMVSKQQLSDALMTFLVVPGPDATGELHGLSLCTQLLLVPPHKQVLVHKP